MASSSEARGQPAPIIIRATDGKGKKSSKTKSKLSTIVEPGSLVSFYSRYADVCKAGMPALKPRDKSRKKEKAKARKKRLDGAGGAGGAAKGTTTVKTAPAP